MKEITIENCYELRDKFMTYANRAEQHEFIILAKLNIMMDHSIGQWSKDGIDQKEARSMFRTILRYIGEDFSEYEEK